MPIRRYEVHIQTDGKGLPEMEERVSGWMPIETAPKDGTWVLAHSHEWELPEVVTWSLYSDRWQNMETGLFHQPTYWMPLLPLPDPPTEG